MSARLVLALGLLGALSGCHARSCGEWDASYDSGRADARADGGALDGGPVRYVVDRDADARPEPVWGAADLHAHLAGHLGLGGGPDGRGGILFGTPESGGNERGRITLGPESSCDGETHARGATDPATRLTQSIIFSLFGTEGHRAHTPMYSRSTCDAAETDASAPSLPSGPFAHWPHAQDLYHQAMFVPEIRRAWEGGLRVMFAAVSDTQSIARVMNITLAPGPITVDLAQERRSALRELDYIESLVGQPENGWMEIAYSPSQAREIIARGHLAIVLSLEVDSLSLADVDALHERGFRHIIPVHVVDNEVGGAAAYSDIFNLHNAVFQTALHPGGGLQFYRLTHDACISETLGSPFRASLVAGLLFFPGADEDGLWTNGYADPAALCGTGAFTPMGTRNQLGLGPSGAAYVSHLMELGMMVDITHMSVAAASDTMDLAEALRYPVLAGHTGVAHPGERVGKDRDLPFDLARRIYRNQHGIVGLGTGTGSRVIGELYHARGAWDLRSGDTTRLVPCTTDHSSAGLGAAAQASAQICVEGLVASQGFVTVETCTSPVTPSVNFELVPVLGSTTSCTAPLGIGAQLASVTYHGSRDPHCGVQTLRAPVAGVVASMASSPCTLPAPMGAVGAISRAYVRDGASVTEFHLPIGGGAHAIADPQSGLTSLTLAASACPSHHPECESPAATRPITPPITPAAIAPYQLVPGTRVLRIMATGDSSFAYRVRGSSFAYDGVDVVLTMRVEIGPAGETRELRELRVTLNHRGLWLNDVHYDEYLLLDRIEETDEVRVASVSIALSGDDAGGYPWRLDELRIEEIEDPILAWASSYARLREEIQSARSAPAARDTGLAPDDTERLADVVFAIGTDINGYAAQFAVSGIRPDMSDLGGDFLVCDAVTGECQPLRLNERGMANYAMLADFFRALETSTDGVRDGLMSSAEATLRMWEIAEQRSRQMRGETP